MPLDDTPEEYEHRSHIDGVPHCPACGGMLWPPSYTGNVTCEDGEEMESILDSDPTKVHYHTECYEKKFGDRDTGYEPEIDSENGDEPRISSV